MDRTEENVGSQPRLPVAYSQGYVYAATVQTAGIDPDTQNGDPISQPKRREPIGSEPLPFSQIAVGALAGLIGPFLGATIFLLLSNY